MGKKENAFNRIPSMQYRTEEKRDAILRPRTTKYTH
jgi:hypothetical protein